MHTVVVTVNISKPSFFLEVAVFFQLSTNKLLVHTMNCRLVASIKTVIHVSTSGRIFLVIISFSLNKKKRLIGGQAIYRFSSSPSLSYFLAFQALINS
jgi:hypothetical protein